VSEAVSSPGRDSWVQFVTGFALAALAAVLFGVVSHSDTFPRTGAEAALAVLVTGGLAVGVLRPEWCKRVAIGVFVGSIIAPLAAGLSGLGGALGVIAYPPLFVMVPAFLTFVFAATASAARALVWAWR
jgi:hypothetical protein